MSKITRTSVYGSKAYEVVASAALGPFLYAFSKESDSVFHDWNLDKTFLFPAYGLDNEIILVDTNTKKSVLKYVESLLAKLERHFSDGEHFYIIHYNIIDMLIGKYDNRNLKKRVEEKLNVVANGDYYGRTILSTCWPCTKLKLVPLQISDFWDTIKQLRHPDFKEAMTDPFIIEYRRNLLKTMLKTGPRSPFGDMHVNILWLMQKTLTKDTLVETFKRSLNNDEKEWLESSDADEYIDAANMIKNQDWIDPVFILARKCYYKML